MRSTLRPKVKQLSVDRSLFPSYLGERGVPGLRWGDEKSIQCCRCEHKPGSGKALANAGDAVSQLFHWFLTRWPRRAGQLQERATATLPCACCYLRPSVRPQYLPPPSSAFPTPFVPTETLWAWRVIAHAELTPSLPGSSSGAYKWLMGTELCRRFPSHPWYVVGTQWNNDQKPTS